MLELKGENMCQKKKKPNSFSGLCSRHLLHIAPHTLSARHPEGHDPSFCSWYYSLRRFLSFFLALTLKTLLCFLAELDGPKPDTVLRTVWLSCIPSNFPFLNWSLHSPQTPSSLLPGLPTVLVFFWLPLVQTIKILCFLPCVHNFFKTLLADRMNLFLVIQCSWCQGIFGDVFMFYSAHSWQETGIHWELESVTVLGI